MCAPGRSLSTDPTADYRPRLRWSSSAHRPLARGATPSDVHLLGGREVDVTCLAGLRRWECVCGRLWRTMDATCARGKITALGEASLAD